MAEKEKTVRIKLPILPNDEGDVFVSVNDRTWQIKRGEYVDVPECVAEVLDRADDMRLANARRIQALRKDK